MKFCVVVTNDSITTSHFIDAYNITPSVTLIEIVQVRASYNFVLAAPIITTGVFDQEHQYSSIRCSRLELSDFRAQDVTEEQAMADPRLYVSGREGWAVIPISYGFQMELR